jgi:hypothetical protein
MVVVNKISIIDFINLFLLGITFTNNIVNDIVNDIVNNI